MRPESEKRHQPPQVTAKTMLYKKQGQATKDEQTHVRTKVLWLSAVERR